MAILGLLNDLGSCQTNLWKEIQKILCSTPLFLNFAGFFFPTYEYFLLKLGRKYRKQLSLIPLARTSVLWATPTCRPLAPVPGISTTGGTSHPMGSSALIL